MIRRHGYGRAASALLALLTMATLGVPSAATDLSGEGGASLPELRLFPEARFTWSVPERYGLDRNGDDLIDMIDGVEPAEGWQVNFDACDSIPSSGATILLYKWFVDRVQIGNPDAQTSPCGGFTYYFPTEGSYEITLEVSDSAGKTNYVIQDIVVQDWLIVALGDSFGSGEGNPDIPIPSAVLTAAEEARRVYQSVLRELADAEDAYQDTLYRVGVARSRYFELLRELDYCNMFSPGYNPSRCSAIAINNATIALTNALNALGLEALIDSLGLIEDSLTSTLDLARDAADLAILAVSSASADLERAEEGLSPTWQDRRCHRSAYSGQAQAALALERSDPHTSVTFIHLACSGGEIFKGLIGPYAGAEAPADVGDLPPQVDVAAALVGTRQVDAILLSVGGNDVGFGPIVESCMFQEPCDESTTVDWPVDLGMSRLCLAMSIFEADCSEYADWTRYRLQTDGRSGAEIFDDGKAALPYAYDALAVRLAQAFHATSPSRVFITEYPDAVTDSSGSYFCEYEWDPFDMLPGISNGEAGWLWSTVTTELNELVATAATEHGWTLVDGIFNTFYRHGYCADIGWFRRLHESFLMQGAQKGAVHPTAEGHEIIGEKLFAALAAALYPAGGVGGGDWVPPFELANLPWSVNWRETLETWRERIVEPTNDSTAPTVLGMPDRKPDWAGWYTTDVIIDWQATDPLPSAGPADDPPDTVAGSEGSHTYISDPSCDTAGNCNTGSLTLRIDKTNPTLSCPVPAPQFVLIAAGAMVVAQVDDGQSGPVSMLTSGAADTATVGTKTVALTGEDVAGHTTTENCEYLVTYDFGSGFAAPLDGGDTLNVVKAGRAIPLIWRLTDASGLPITNLSSARVTVSGLACSLGSSTSVVEETTAGGSGLQNLGDGWYQYNWKTPAAYAGSCKTMHLDLGEGLVHTALFMFTK